MALNSAQLIGTGLLDGFRNRIINGSMRIDQRNSGAALTINTAQHTTAFPVDRFRFGSGGGSWGAGVLSAQQRNGIITANTNYEAGASPGAQVSNSSIKLTVTTADSSLASTDGYTLAQLLEIGSVSDFAFGSANAQAVTLSFWVKSSITGTYCASLYASSSGRSYVATYTIATANTWEYKTITIPGDTSGTWFQTDPALNVRWDLGSGTGNNAASANTWGAGNFTRISSSVNWISTLNATFYITGVQLEKGSVATEFEFRSSGQELALCQRYYERGDLDVRRGSSEAGQGQTELIRFSTTKRAAPSITLGGSIATVNVTSDSALAITDNGFMWTVVPANTGGYSFYGRIFLSSAEL